MLATMARADRSARAEIMTSLASSMRSLFLARKARPHRAPAPADVRDYEKKRRQRTHRLRIFAFSRLESVGDRRRGTTRADIVGSQRGRRAAVPFSRSRLRPTRSITSALIASCCTRLASRGSSYTGESLHGQFAFMIRTPAIGFRHDTLSSIAIIATPQAYDRPATLRIPTSIAKRRPGHALSR